MMNRLGLLFLLGFLIVGCVGKNAKKQQSAFIVMKTKEVKFADMGFIYESDSNVKMEIYASGQPLVNIDINAENICLSLFECMDKKDFNQKILSSYYPETLFENILRAEPIFEEQNLTTIEGGFSQKISKEGDYNISYSVVRGNRVFRDTINKILIKVRETK